MRRRLLRAALCLLLGAATTLGVALVASRPQRQTGNTLLRYLESKSSSATLQREHACLVTSETYVYAWQTNRYVSIQRSAAARASDGPVQDAPVELRTQGEGSLIAAATRTVEQWDVLFGDNWRDTPLAARMLAGGWGALPGPGENVSIHVTAYGWPKPALWEYETFEGYQKTGHHGSVQIGAWSAPVRRAPVGLLLDMLFYAAPWWALLVTPGLVKRWRRKRRGACLACGYDLRGLGDAAACPECGQAARVAALAHDR